MYALARRGRLARLELVALYDDIERAARAAKILSLGDSEHAYRVFARGGTLVFFAERGRGGYCRRDTDGSSALG
jgi:hypothetical protein